MATRTLATLFSMQKHRGCAGFDGHDDPACGFCDFARALRGHHAWVAPRNRENIAFAKGLVVPMLAGEVADRQLQLVGFFLVVRIGH